MLILQHRWLGITSLGTVEKMGCTNLPLSSKQKEVCKRKPYMLPSIKDGARLGITECQSQFKHERWNCSTSRETSVFGYELTSGMITIQHSLTKLSFISVVSLVCGIVEKTIYNI